MVWNTPPPTPWWNTFPAAAIAASISAVFTMVTTFIFLMQLRINRQHAGSQERSVRAEWERIFLDIADRWSAILPISRKLLEAPLIHTLEELEANYENSGSKTCKDFLCTDEWEKILRPICNFYETIGVILKHKCIDPDPIFVLVTVDNHETIDEVDAGGNVTERKEFAIYRWLKGPIAYLRKYYRPDIYEYYDRYLLAVYSRYLDNSESRMLDLAKEARLRIDCKVPPKKPFRRLWRKSKPRTDVPLGLTPR